MDGVTNNFKEMTKIENITNLKDGRESSGFLIANRNCKISLQFCSHVHEGFMLRPLSL